MGFLDGHAAAESLCQSKEALVVDKVHFSEYFFIGQVVEFGHIQMDQADFQAADRLQDGGFHIAFDGHDFARCLHLGPQRMVGIDEFIEGPAGDLQYDIVQGRFEAGRGLLGDGVLDLIERITGSDLGCHLGNGIARRFGGKSGGTGNTGIDFDDDVFLRIGVQGILHVAATFHAQFADDIDGSRTEHLHFPVRQGLARCHDDAVARVDSDGVEVFHVADGDAVVSAVADDFEFDFLPAGDAAFDQDLADQAVLQAFRADIVQFLIIVGNTAARAAQGIGRTDDERIADLVGKFRGSRDRLHDGALRDGLMQFLHRLLEEFPVFSLHDAGDLRAQELHIVFFQDAQLIQFHGKVQADLAAQGCQQGIRAFLGNDAFQEFHVQRFHIDAVGDMDIRHDRGRVGIDEDDFQAFFLEGPAGLRTGIVEFSGLTDDDRAGTDDHDFLYILFLWHNQCPPIILIKRSNK